MEENAKETAPPSSVDRKRKKKWLTTMVVVLLVGGAYWHASRHVPTGPARGDRIEGRITRTPTAGRTIRIATFNIHSCKGRDGRRDLDRVADCLKGFDFVALNEARGPRILQPEGQASRLGEKLGMAWLFAPGGRTWYYRLSGNAMLTVLPVRFWQRIPLPQVRDYSYRNVVLAALEHEGRTIHVLITHLVQRYQEDREEQLRAVIELFLALAEPAILMGDLNDGHTNPQIEHLLSMPGVKDPLEETLGPDPPWKIDWIITRGFRAVDAGMVDEGASDHPMVWAELELLPE